MKKKWARWMLVALLVGLGFQSWATTISQTIHINKDSLLAVDSVKFPALAFNATPLFDKENTRLIIAVGDTLELTIVNHDAIMHGFNIKGYSGIAQSVPAGDSTTVSCTFSAPSVHIYYDQLNYPTNRYLGLAGMIVVKTVGENVSDFFWNIKEHRKNWSDSLDAGFGVDWDNYYPDYFTINGRSNPHINQDPNARVSGMVGDTIHIYMVNTGQAAHSFHFHGYHATVYYTTANPHITGRLKDTFPMRSMEAMILELVPHQPGEFPVHDHNLLAVSAGGLYPNGIFLTMLIQ